VGPGIFLAVVGAILVFAVRADASVVDLQVVGLILMIAGAAVMVHARRGTRRERVITRVDEPTDPTRPTHTVEKSITDRDVK
jgi:uncharacterized membrane protein HdeD (DUF308 family)